MKIEIQIPKEFDEEFQNDAFEGTLKRLCLDAHLMAGTFEIETAEMLIKAFQNFHVEYQRRRDVLWQKNEK